MWSPGDTFKIRVNGSGNIEYLQNNDVVYTSRFTITIMLV